MPFPSSKNINLKKTVSNFPEVVDRYCWNENTETFEQETVNLQDEIEASSFVDYKEQLERTGIINQLEGSPVYADVSNLSNMTATKLFYAANTEITPEDGDDVKADDVKTDPVDTDTPAPESKPNDSNKEALNV